MTALTLPVPSLVICELLAVRCSLFARVPSLRLAVDQDDLSYKDKATIYGLYRLPVTW